jgi:glycosyltransferase involved in cell wall biosynthesis
MQFPSQAYGAHYGPWLVPAAIALQRVPVVQTWHEYYPAGSGWRNILNAITPGGLVVVRPNYLEQMPGWYRRLVSRKLFRMIPSAAALPAVRLSDAERQALRARLGVKSRRLIAYFGFVYPAKGVETVFSIASATEDRVVLIGELKPDDPYHQEVSRRIATAEWRDHVVTTGFLPEADAAAILAAADAVVLPFVDGGGLWNTSIQAASKQGTFVLTTSRERQGYDSELNTFYAKPGDIEAMRRALREYSGRRVERSADTGAQEWEGIAEAHRRVYEQVLGRPA